jgi:hypothetical protein
MNPRTSGPTARTRRLQKARSRTVGRRLKTSHPRAIPRGVSVERAGREKAPRSIAAAFGAPMAIRPSPARDAKYTPTAADLTRQPAGTTKPTVRTTGQAKIHTAVRKSRR